MIAVIMAGGEGLRCRPLTATTPKPMLPVGGKPLLATLLAQLAKAGATRFFLNVRYLGEQIEAYVGDHYDGIDVHYLREPEPYGTAGGLALIPPELRPTEPFLVVNGDLLTPIDFAAFYGFHRAKGRALSLVGRSHAVAVPYGFPVTQGDQVVSFEEKPMFLITVNSGIYCLEPGLLDFIEPPCDMPTIIRWACPNVSLFPLTVPYHEIGTPASYAHAEAFYQEHMR